MLQFLHVLLVLQVLKVPKTINVLQVLQVSGYLKYSQHLVSPEHLAAHKRPQLEGRGLKGVGRLSIHLYGALYNTQLVQCTGL